MKIHEYQAKELFRNAGVAVPNGIPVFTVDEAVKAAEKLQAGGAKGFVVKAQIHAGGRGKGGGVKIAKTLEGVRPLAEEILGMTLITHQTGPEGKLVQRLFIEEANPPRVEMYLSLILDRDRSCVSILASAEGGMDIEELAEKSPEKILTLAVDPGLGWQPFYSRQLASFLGLTLNLKAPSKMFQQLHNFMDNLYTMFIEKDCSILEINPLAICGEGDSEILMALDGKINFDSNALGRHPDIKELQDPTEEDAAELEAAKWDLNFISLDGNIGCMVNGAGLAMSTMDIIQHYGGEPANFLDVGGGATAEKVTEAFKLITKDPKVKAIFVNIFGGIMKCDTIAEGVIAATKEVGLELPLIVRLEGTNVEKGRQLLAESGLKITAATSMDDGAKKVVAAMKEGN